ncbi:uncharacterized protein LOC120083086 isoform X4 [Benincasa hispida]|uniref:uncharacterized protein LOC120083086 isoform X4 n=1 Tax=Benincasa hispida TaxID=102211 RepID=UPI001901EA4C|nr:uncharacterized protein LOC120083086 isoform X4 [Benincasa hispida]
MSENVLGIRWNGELAANEWLVKWKGLPESEATWELVYLMNEQFPHFHFKDKVPFSVPDFYSLKCSYISSVAGIFCTFPTTTSNLLVISISCRSSSLTFTGWSYGALIPIENPNVGGKRFEAASDWQNSSCAEKISSANDDVSHSVLPMRSNLLEDSKEVTSSHKKPDNDDKEVDISDHGSTESHVLKNERDVVSEVHLEGRSSSEELKRERPNGKEQHVQTSRKLNRENINNRTVDEAQLTTIESKPWGERMKSIVDGIINMWRKR